MNNYRRFIDGFGSLLPVFGSHGALALSYNPSTTSTISLVMARPQLPRYTSDVVINIAFVVVVLLLCKPLLNVNRIKRWSYGGLYPPKST